MQGMYYLGDKDRLFMLSSFQHLQNNVPERFKESVTEVLELFFFAYIFFETTLFNFIISFFGVNEFSMVHI